jgi:hypothetical protein
MPLTPENRHRFWIVVTPVGRCWQVDFGAISRPYLYTTQDEALVVARSAAKLHWEDRREPSGALLDVPGEHRHVVATYGRVPHLVRARAG